MSEFDDSYTASCIPTLFGFSPHIFAMQWQRRVGIMPLASKQEAAAQHSALIIQHDEKVFRKLKYCR